MPTAACLHAVSASRFTFTDRGVWAAGNPRFIASERKVLRPALQITASLRPAGRTGRCMQVLTTAPSRPRRPQVSLLPEGASEVRTTAPKEAIRTGHVTESRARVDGAINACRCDSCSRSSTYGCLQNSGDLESSLAARAARPRFRQSAPACSPASCRWHEPRRARTCRNQAQSRSRLFEHRAPFLDLMTKLWPSMSQ